MIKLNRFIAAIALTVPTLVAAAASAPAAKLEIAFTGIEAPTGAIMVALFDSEASYNDGKPIRGVGVPVTKADAATLIEGLPAGRYAIKSFHDVDGDGKMDTNPFGMPTEPFAFSNNAAPSMGPAKWADAAFDVSEAGAKQSITIQ
jgi:uncharacterized protein (DUF2141 family)